MSFGLALSGGGVKGAAHVGVLLALEENGLYPTSISGTSSGSIVAGLYSSGVPVKEMKKMVADMSKNGYRYMDVKVMPMLGIMPNLLVKKQITMQGFLKGNKFEEYFAELTKNQNIDQLKMITIIPAVDLYSAKTIVFTNWHGAKPDSKTYGWKYDVPISKAIRASISFPAVFTPVFMDDWCLVDGGVTTNLPVDLLIASGTKNVIAVDVSTDNEMPATMNFIDISYRTFSIMNNYLMELRTTGEKILLKPPFSQKSNLLSFEYMNTYMEEAYQYTRSLIPVIKAVIDS